MVVSLCLLEYVHNSCFDLTNPTIGNGIIVPKIKNKAMPKNNLMSPIQSRIPTAAVAACIGDIIKL